MLYILQNAFLLAIFFFRLISFILATAGSKLEKGFPKDYRETFENFQELIWFLTFDLKLMCNFERKKKSENWELQIIKKWKSILEKYHKTPTIAPWFEPWVTLDYNGTIIAYKGFYSYPLYLLFCFVKIII